MDTIHSGVIIVVLRQPYNDPKEKRSDPFWEFGSFGSTKCHYTNLMNPKKAYELEKKRFAFAQGGHEGFKLVYLTSPLSIIKHNGFIEAKWSPILMPFKYLYAPLFINNQGQTDIHSIKNEIKRVNRTTWMGQFTSAFRSRKRPVSEKIANELISVYDQKRSSKNKDLIAVSYEEALPFNPHQIDHNRKKTYQSLIRKNARSC